MPALHKIHQDPSKIRDSIREYVHQELSESLALLTEHVSSILADEIEASFAHHESELEKRVHDLGREALKLILSRYDISSQQISDGDEVYRKVLCSDKMYQTSFGPVSLTRHLYKRRGRGGKSICPLELQSGIIESAWTPNAAKQAMWLLSHMTPQEAEDTLAQFSGMKPSKSSLDRLPKRLGERWEPSSSSFYEKLMTQEKIPDDAVLCATSLDGVMVAMKGDKTLEKTDDHAVCHWREGSCGTISFFDKQGERLSTIQYGSMPEHKKLTLKQLLRHNVEWIRQSRPDLSHLYIADGALDNWTFFDEEMPLATQLTDYFHACEYLKKAFDAGYKNSSDKAQAKYHEYKIILRDEKGGIQK